jgi:Protein of unknown function (DUF1638)
VTQSDRTPDSTASERWAVVACGALSLSVQRVVATRGWPVDVHPLPPLLHNRPEKIAGAVEAAVHDLRPRYRQVVVAYADCGTYGALDEVCDRLGLARLPGQHCYDVYAGVERYAELMRSEPGTYVLTDFLAASFHRSVVVELGLDRYPELRQDYFGNYTRVVWLAQHPTPVLTVAAQRAAQVMGLPLQQVDVGDLGLEQQLAQVLGLL